MIGHPFIILVIRPDNGLSYLAEIFSLILPEYVTCWLIATFISKCFLTEWFPLEQEQLLLLRRCTFVALAGRPRIRFPVGSFGSFTCLIIPATQWPWGRLSLQNKWVPRISAGDKGCWCVKVTNFLPSYAYYMGAWKSWSPESVPRDSFTVLPSHL